MLTLRSEVTIFSSDTRQLASQRPQKLLLWKENSLPNVLDLIDILYWLTLIYVCLGDMFQFNLYSALPIKKKKKKNMYSALLMSNRVLHIAYNMGSLVSLLFQARGLFSESIPMWNNSFALQSTSPNYPFFVRFFLLYAGLFHVTNGNTKIRSTVNSFCHNFNMADYIWWHITFIWTHIFFSINHSLSHYNYGKKDCGIRFFRPVIVENMPSTILW